MEIIIGEYGETLLGILAGFAVTAMFAGLLWYITSF